MLIVSIFVIVTMVTTFWIVADYRKWLQVAYIRTAIKENLVLPLLQHKKKKYKIIGVEHDGTFLLESLDTESHVKLHYRKVKFLWK